MKAIVSIAACLFMMSSMAMADKSIRIINNSKSSDMTLHVESCVYKEGTVTCKALADVNLPSVYEPSKGPNYTTVTLPVPPGSEDFLHVDSVKAVDVVTKQIIVTQYSTDGLSKLKNCDGFQTGDIIVLDPMGADVVVCNDRGMGLSK